LDGYLYFPKIHVENSNTENVIAGNCTFSFLKKIIFSYAFGIPHNIDYCSGK